MLHLPKDYQRKPPVQTKEHWDKERKPPTEKQQKTFQSKFKTTTF